MKTARSILSIALLLALALTAYAADPVSETLQKGLFEEEANHNLDAAIQAYQSVIDLGNEQRKMTATAIFRLGECYRKQGKNPEAIAQYERVLRDYSDQAVLVKFSQQNLATLGAGQASSTNVVAAAPATNVEAEEVQRIKAMIKDSPDLINVAGKGGLGLPRLTPLCDAAGKGYLVVAAFLLSSGADPEQKDTAGRAPLHIAVENGHKAMVELLLARHANVNSRNIGGATPLAIAAGKGFRAVAEVLLANKANVNSKDNVEAAPLHYAAGAGLKAMVDFLLANGADVNARDKSGGTPLSSAVSAGHLAVAELLLDHKADPNLAGRGWSPLFVAVRDGQLDLAKLLLDRGADTKARLEAYQYAANGYQITRRSLTALHLAVNKGDTAMVELLLKFHPEVNATDAGGATPLLYAVALRELPIASLLLANGAEANFRGDFSPPEVDRYNQRGVQYRQVTPLQVAVQAGLPDMVELLLRYKADVNVTNDRKETPLRVAVNFNQNKEIAELLLRANANPNAADVDGYTPLHLAVWNRQKEIVALLLEHGAKVNVLTTSGRTPLSFATERLRNEPWPSETATLIAQMLREHGAIDDLQRGSFITASRKDRNITERLFEADTNGYNRFTLFEAIAQVYGGLDPRQTPASQWGFPDFARVRINRLTAKEGETKDINVNLDVAFSSGDTSKNLWLDWGDVVEIPEQDHLINTAWNGLSAQAYETLQKCLQWNIQIVVNGHTNTITLKPHLPHAGPQIMTGQFGVILGAPPEPVKEMTTFWLYDVVLNAGVLRSSSDVAHVKVHRLDPATKESRDMVFNLEKRDRRNDLWLRPGDVIEVPEK